MTDIYRCDECAILTDKPSWSDVSSEREDSEGRVRHDYRHIALCNECHRPMRQLSPMAAQLVEVMGGLPQ